MRTKLTAEQVTAAMEGRTISKAAHLLKISNHTMKKYCLEYGIAFRSRRTGRKCRKRKEIMIFWGQPMGVMEDGYWRALEAGEYKRYPYYYRPPNPIPVYSVAWVSDRMEKEYMSWGIYK